MTGTVPTLSIVFMAVSCAICFLTPLALFLYLRLVKKADIYPFFAGCAVMLLFAFILESGLHSLVFSSPAGPAIRNNIWLYALYGGFMAGLFEETGRYLAFSFALKKYNNIIWSVMINNGSISSMISSLPGDQVVQAQQSVTLLATTPSYQFLLGGAERLLAVTLHIALSVIVWFAVKWDGKLYLYPAAILIHFAVDAAAALLSGLDVNVILIEIVVAVLTAAAALFARRLWRETM